MDFGTVACACLDTSRPAIRKNPSGIKPSGFCTGISLEANIWLYAWQTGTGICLVLRGLHRRRRGNVSNPYPENIQFSGWVLARSASPNKNAILFGWHFIWWANIKLNRTRLVIFYRQYKIPHTCRAMLNPSINGIVIKSVALIKKCIVSDGVKMWHLKF